MVRDMYNSGHLAVLSFSEGGPTHFSGVLPKMWIVPTESAYPGFGELVVLPGTDHINACKPSTREDEAYEATVSFIRERVDEVLQSKGEQEEKELEELEAEAH